MNIESTSTFRVFPELGFISVTVRRGLTQRARQVIRPDQPEEEELNAECTPGTLPTRSSPTDSSLLSGGQQQAREESDSSRRH